MTSEPFALGRGGTAVKGAHEYGFETVPEGKMAVVNPIGNNMFKFVYSEERIGPFRLCTTTRGRWYYVAQKHGMRRDVIDRMCGMK